MSVSSYSTRALRSGFPFSWVLCGGVAHHSAVLTGSPFKSLITTFRKTCSCCCKAALASACFFGSALLPARSSDLA